MQRLKKIAYIVLGCVGLGLGAVGAVVPILPTFPFLMLAAFAFAKSSQKLHNWFINTRLYKKNFESYAAGKGMTWASKFRVMTTITLLMGVGFTMMLLKGHYVPCVILGVVWILHILYFIFGVKVIKSEK